MKNFDELTDAEVVALTLDQVQTYINRECLEAGIPLADDPGQPPTLPIGEDLDVYTVAGLTFTSRADALRLFDLLNTLPSRIETVYSSGPGYKLKARPAPPLDKVQETRVFSELLADQRAAQISEQERLMAEWQERRGRYEKIARRRKDIFEEIMARRSAATKTIQRITNIREQHARYMDLAEGKRRTASRFLLAFDADAEQLCPDLFIFGPNDSPDVPLSGKRFYSAADTVDVAQEDETVF